MFVNSLEVKETGEKILALKNENQFNTLSKGTGKANDKGCILIKPEYHNDDDDQPNLDSLADLFIHLPPSTPRLWSGGYIIDQALVEELCVKTHCL